MNAFRTACCSGLFAILLGACTTVPWSKQAGTNEVSLLRNDVVAIVAWTWFVRGAQPAELDAAYEELRIAPLSRLNSARIAIVRSRPGLSAYDPDTVQKLLDAMSAGQTADADDAVYADLLHFLSNSVATYVTSDDQIAEHYQARERLQGEIIALKNELRSSGNVQTTLHKKLETRILETDGIVSSDAADEE